MNNDNTTPRPWAIQKRGDGLYYEIQHNREDGVAISVQDLGYVVGRKHNKANAELIVKAVNAYDGLKAKADMFDELVGLNGALTAIAKVMKLADIPEHAKLIDLEERDCIERIYTNMKNTAQHALEKAKEITE